MKIRHLLLIPILLGSLGVVRAQRALAPLVRDDSSTVTFSAMQRTFDRWSKERDLGSESGWKWYRRWEAFTEQRVGRDGTLPDASVYLDAAATKAKRGGSLMGGPGWVPVGPTTLAPAYSEYLNEGMGRINCVAFHPTDTSTFWVGVAQGGVWKTADGGATWRPLTDHLPVIRISDIAVDPRDPDVLYISVGDYAYLGVDLPSADRKRNTHYGLGVYKTTDGGERWAPTGLSFGLEDFDGSLIRRVFVHPNDSRELLAAGTSGTWRSSDAGATWSRGREDLIWDIERDPWNPEIIFASTGHLALQGIGAASVIRSTDFGATWRSTNIPIPPTAVQRIEIAFAPSDPNVVYAIADDLERGLHSLHRSTDGGATWSLRHDQSTWPNILGANFGHEPGGQGSYDLAIVVDPNDADRVFVGGINVWGSEDGGATWNMVAFWTRQFGDGLHADHHFFAVNPLNGRYYFCNDGGINATDRIVIGNIDEAMNDEGYAWPTTWRNLSGGMAITSFYRLGLSRDNPGYIVAGAQDNSTFYLDGQGWHHIFGGDGMDCFLDPVDPKIVYGSSQFGSLHKSDDGGRTGLYYITRDILTTPNEAGEWTTPFMMHPTERGSIYAGMVDVWRTDGDDTTWRRLSNFSTMTNSTAPMSAMAIAPGDPGYIYAAKKIWHAYDYPTELFMSSDGGATWTRGGSGLPDSLYLTSLAIDADDPRTVWASFAGFVDGAKIYRSTDAGWSWTNVSRDLPNLPVNVVVHDPRGDDDVLFVGTDAGVYYTSTSMEGWLPLGEHLPNVIVSDLELHAATNGLYAATFGRGIWSIDLTGGISGVSRPEVAASDLRVRVVPEADGLVVETTSGTTVADGRLEIVDVRGGRLHATSIDVAAGEQRRTLDVSLADGLYFLRLSHRGGTSVARFVIER